MELTLNGKTFTIGSQLEGREKLSEVSLHAYCDIDDVAEAMVIPKNHIKTYNEWSEWFNETYVQMCGVIEYSSTDGFYFQGVVYYEDYMCMLYITPTNNYIYFI